jgi:hypothetical protein
LQKSSSWNFVCISQLPHPTNRLFGEEYEMLSLTLRTSHYSCFLPLSLTSNNSPYHTFLNTGNSWLSGVMVGSKVTDNPKPRLKQK